jgi:hypothetical protein
MVNPMLSQMLEFLKRLLSFLLFIGLARTARWVFAIKGLNGTREENFRRALTSFPPHPLTLHSGFSSR